MDVHHFFESINRRILKRKLKEVIRDKRFYRLLCILIEHDKIALVAKILTDAGVEIDAEQTKTLVGCIAFDDISGALEILQEIGITGAMFDELKEIIEEMRKGVPLGYFTSQWFGNFYLKALDHYEEQVWEDAKASNTVSVHFLGISESVFDKLEWRGEKCSWDTFKSGNYVLVDYGDKYAEHPVSYYQTGDVFQMEYKNGNQKDYEVIGEALMPYALDYPYADLIYITVLVPEDEYITQTGNESAMYAAIDAKKGEDKKIKEYIDENILKENDMINVFSVLDMKASFRRFVSKYYMIGSFLVVILAFIGIMNFFNTTATSVISRKKELALLEVVGMTKKQVSKMLVIEGFLYLGGAFVIAVLLVVFGAEKILANTLGTAFFFRLHLTIVPCVLMIPILVGIAYVIPKYQFEKMSRESVVERIHKE